MILNDKLGIGGAREQWPGFDHFQAVGIRANPLSPLRVEAADEQGRAKFALDEREAIEAIVERALMQEQLGRVAERPVAAQRAQVHVEDRLGHAALVRRARRADKRDMQTGPIMGQIARWALDFALPPRCAGCGVIVAEVHSFCADCWKQIEFLGSAGCIVCGTPLEATDAERCALWLARPPRIARSRAAVVYDDLTRSLALRLKYGRKVAVAKTMARYMAPLVGEQPEGAVLVPVPLHRGRLWQRGFNQSGVIALELARRTGLASDCLALRRIKRTPPLKGMSQQQRRRAVAGAFKVGDDAALAGRTVVLVDDVLTTGSTANACARELRRAGAARVELISWARVVRPARLMR